MDIGYEAPEIRMKELQHTLHEDENEEKHVNQGIGRFVFRNLIEVTKIGRLRHAAWIRGTVTTVARSTSADSYQTNLINNAAKYY